MKELHKETEATVEKVVKDDKEGKLKEYTTTEIISVRDALVTAATVRLARRSKELMTMTLQEVEAAEIIKVNERFMHVVKVKIQYEIKF